MEKSENSNSSEPPYPMQAMLNRTPTEEYLQEWSRLLQKKNEPPSPMHQLSVLIFRLYQEWFALPTSCFAEVLETRPCHRIPGRSNKLLLGTVNFRGQLCLCCSLEALLHMTKEEESARLPLNSAARMLAIQREGQIWVFPVQEVASISSCDLFSLENVPLNVAQSKANFVKGLFVWNQKHVVLLDDELIFHGLRRRIQ